MVKNEIPIRGEVRNHGYWINTVVYTGRGKEVKFSVRIRGPLLKIHFNAPVKLLLVPAEGDPRRPIKALSLYSDLPGTAQTDLVQTIGTPLACASMYRISEHQLTITEFNAETLLPGRPYDMYLAWLHGVDMEQITSRIAHAQFVYDPRRTFSLQRTHYENVPLFPQRAPIPTMFEEQQQEYCRAPMDMKNPYDQFHLFLGTHIFHQFWIPMRRPDSSNHQVRVLFRRFLLEQGLHKKKERAGQEYSGQACPVCLDDLNEDSAIERIGCGNNHVMCEQCFQECAKHQHKTCPLCRKPATGLLQYAL